MTHITIIGGGITGLATAFYLQKHSREQNIPLSYTLIEAAPRFGGKVVTEVTEADFVIEGGPDSFITTKPWASQLCRDLGLSAEIIPTNDDQRNIFILNQGKLVPFPGGLRLTVPTELLPFIRSPLITPGGKLRMGLELLIPKRQAETDESLGSFIRRRFGQEAVDKFAGPLMAGIYVADPERLSIQSTFPNFVEMERQHGSLIKAMQLAKKQAPPSAPGKAPAMFYSLRGGMGTLIGALLRQLEGDLRLNCQVTALRPLSPGFEITLADPNASKFTTDVVVLAIPAYAAADLVELSASQLATQLRKIRYVSTATISLGYRQAEVLAQHPLDGFGFLIPKNEQRQLIACTWTSTKFNHRAPNEAVLLRSFVGGHHQEHLVNLADEALINLVRAELADIIHLTADPIMQKIFRWQKGNPQYDVGHLERVAELERLAGQISSLYLAGSAYRGVGLPDCIKSALTTVDKIFLGVAHQTFPEIIGHP